MCKWEASTSEMLFNVHDFDSISHFNHVSSVRRWMSVVFCVCRTYIHTHRANASSVSHTPFVFRSQICTNESRSSFRREVNDDESFRRNKFRWSRCRTLYFILFSSIHTTQWWWSIGAISKWCLLNGIYVPLYIALDGEYVSICHCIVVRWSKRKTLS